MMGRSSEDILLGEEARVAVEREGADTVRPTLEANTRSIEGMSTPYAAIVFRGTHEAEAVMLAGCCAPVGVNSQRVASCEGTR